MITLYIFFSGLLSILGQVILFRELLSSFSGNELPIIFGLGIVIFSSSLGALTTYKTEEKRLSFLFFIFALTFTFLFILSSSLRPIFNVPKGLILPLEKQLLASLFLIFPFGFIAGKLFAESSILYVEKKGKISHAYALDTFGAAVGGFISLLANILKINQSFVALFVIFLSFFISSLYKWKWFKALIILILFFSSITPFEKLHLKILRLDEPHLKEIKETPFGRLSLSTYKEQVFLHLNNNLIMESQSPYKEELVHIGALFSKRLEKVLLIGGTPEGFIEEIEKFCPKKVIAIENDEALFLLPKKYLGYDHLKNLHSIDVKVLIGEGRKFINSSKEKFDLVILNSSEPSTLSENRFFTYEFFLNVKNALTDEGVFIFRLKSSENYLTPMMIARNISILKALKDVFRNILILHSGNLIALSSKGRIYNLQEILKKFNNLNVESRLITENYIKYLFLNDRTEKWKTLLDASEIEPNKDLNPKSYFETIILQTSRFFPKISTNLNFLTYSKNLTYFLIFTTFLLLIFLKKNKAYLYAFLSGFSCMAYETILLLFYQTKFGLIYKEIGILLSLFMAGLGIGSRFLFAKPLNKKTLFILFLFYIFLSTLLVLIINRILLTFIFYLIFLIFGTISGSIFKIADQTLNNFSGNNIKKLLFFDLLGGSVAALLFPLFIIPLFGYKAALLVPLFSFCFGL